MLAAIASFARLPTQVRLGGECLFALALIGIATWLRQLLDPWLGARAVFITYFPAVVSVAWFCSFLPTLLAIAASLWLALYYFMAPVGDVRLHDPAEALQAALYLVASLGIAALSQVGRAARLRAEESARLLNSMMANAPVIFDRIGPDRRHLYISPAVERITGMPPAAFIGRSNAELGLPRDQVRAWDEALDAVLATGAERQLEADLTVNGRPWRLHTRLVPERDAHGRIVSVLAVTDDITEREGYRKDLERHARELERSNSELEQFAYIAAHDLQEPTRMIATYLQLIERHLGRSMDDKARGYFAFVVASATRMREMVRSILDYSRIGRDDPGFAPVDTRAAAREALQNLDKKITASGATVELGELPQVQGNRAELTRLFQNLVSNAIKFRGDEPPRVRISAEHADGRWTFAVADNGIGIPSDEGRKLFALFQRLHPADRYPGSGIGLATCKKIVERHGGRIWFEPGPERGSVFRFTLPEVTTDG